ncbi:MAG: glycosyltransferase [Planctomycetota bacterium]
MSPAPAARQKTEPRIAIACDALTAFTEQERIVEEVIDVIGHAFNLGPIYTLLADKKLSLPPHLSEAMLTENVRVSPLATTPGAKSLRRLRPWAVDKLSDQLEVDHASEPIDLVVSVARGYIKGIDAPADARHLCYCTEINRDVWDTASGKQGSLDEKLRDWDRRCISNVDSFLASSRFTAEQIQRVYGRDTRVVYPPVRTDFFVREKGVKREDFWLIAGYHEENPKSALAVEAAMDAGKRAIVVGDGPGVAALKKHAKSHAKHLAKVGLGKKRDVLIDFAGRVPDEQLAGMYRRAALTLVTEDDRFPVHAGEAQSCGCPVIAPRQGGAAEMVLEGRTGAFFPEPTTEAIRAAVKRCPEGVDEQCRAAAKRFSKTVFTEDLLTAIRDTMTA